MINNAWGLVKDKISGIACDLNNEYGFSCYFNEVDPDDLDIEDTDVFLGLWLEDEFESLPWGVRNEAAAAKSRVCDACFEALVDGTNFKAWCESGVFERTGVNYARLCYFLDCLGAGDGDELMTKLLAKATSEELDTIARASKHVYSTVFPEADSVTALVRKYD